MAKRKNWVGFSIDGNSVRLDMPRDPADEVANAALAEAVSAAMGAWIAATRASRDARAAEVARG